MGQCVSQIKQRPKNALNGHQGISGSKATKSTLRKNDDGTGTNVAGLIRINLGDGSEIYRGMEVKGIVKELNQEDLLLAVKNNNFRVVEALCVNYKITNVCEIRGVPGTFELLKREVYNLQNWNLLLIAIAHNHLQAIKFFSQKLKCHLRLALRTPPIASFSKVQESDPAHAETFPVLLAINNRNEEMLKFIWTDLRLLWDSFHLGYVVSELASSRFVEGIKIVLRSQTSHEIYMSMHSVEKLRFLRQALATDKRNHRKWALEVKEALKEELTGQNPYATVALFVLLNDASQGTDSTASYNLNRLHLERALDNVDAFEYARFRHTLASSDPANAQKKAEDFGMIVTMRIGEYLTQEESNSMRHFGEKLRDRLESLDQEVVKLKAPGVASTQEFESIFGVKLFALAEAGSLDEFCQLIQENDVRLFAKRKRYETVARKLPQSFQGLNRYGYMSPLLIAIQKGHHALVSFIIEQMKVPLRQSLYLFPSDPGSNSSNIDMISEEYQSYALLVATYNKDEQMLRYLWQCLGSYLWSERHLEPLMRILIETQWPQGIRTILQSETTHDMIRALSSEERAFFVDNMIGDNLKIGATSSANSSLSSNDPVAALRAAAIKRAQLPENSILEEEKQRLAEEIQVTLKDELTKQPYAGLFVLHLMNHFDHLTEEDFVSWSQCCSMTLDQSVLRHSEGSQGGPLDKPRGILKNRHEQMEETKRSSTSSGGMDMEISQAPPKIGLYKTELLLLSKSQASRFCQFIMDYGINRSDSIQKEQALKFIECLRPLAEFEALIEEGTEEALVNGDEEVKFIKKDLHLAKKLTGPAESLAEVLKYSITGNVRQIQKLLTETVSQDAHTIHIMVLNTRGVAVKAYDHSRDNTLIPTREWNPLLFAIFFQQYKLLRMFIEELSGVAPGGLRSDVKAAISFNRTEREFREDRSYDDVVGEEASQSHIYGYMLAILTKNMAIFKYLYEDCGIQLSETDVLKILRLCLLGHWPQGFLRVINSVVTARIFTFGSLDFKEEFVRFALIESESLVSASVASNKTGVPSQSDEDVIREVKDRMTEFPYCCISWLYFDPFHKELKNQRYIKRLMEETSFNIRALDILAVANQLDKILKKCDKPRINLDFLGEPSALIISNDDEMKILAGNSQEPGVSCDDGGDELVMRNRQDDLMNQKIHEHKMMYVNKVKEIIETGGSHTAYLKKGNIYSEICENIVTEILQKPIMPGLQGTQERIKKFEELLSVAFPPAPTEQENGEDTPSEQQGVEHHKRVAIMLRFVSGYYNFSYWKSLAVKAPLDQIEMEALNLFQWILFFNDHRILSHMLTATPSSQHIQLTQCLMGEQPTIDYILTDAHSGVDFETIKFEKVGLLIAICRRSFECIKILLIPRTDAQMPWSRNLLTNQEVLELAVILAHESQDLWQYFATFDKTSSADPGRPNVTLVSRFIQMTESAFVASSMLRRLQFMRLAMKCAKHGFKEGSFLDTLVREAPHFKYFIQWLNIQPLSQCADPLMIEVKDLIKANPIAEIKSKDALWEHEMERLNFIGRYKPEHTQNAKSDQVTSAAAKQQSDAQELEDEIGIANASKAAAAGAAAERGGAHQRGKNSNGGRVMFQECRDSAEADSD